MEQTATEQTNSQGYYPNKRPLWLWILIYLLIGGLLYAIVYYAFLADRTPVIPPTQDQAAPTQTISPTSALPDTRAEAQLTILATETGFSPQNLTINVGDAVTWTNQTSGPVFVASSPHPAHTDYPLLNLDTMQPGNSVSLAFPDAGTFRYHDHLNPSRFGSIIVQ